MAQKTGSNRLVIRNWQAMVARSRSGQDDVAATQAIDVVVPMLDEMPDEIFTIDIPRQSHATINSSS
jgi:hypothetical protein